jgi:hypothetical protein
MEGAGVNMAEVDQEAVARLEAQRQQQLAESPYMAIYRAKFQAMKDAKIARDKAVKTEPSAEPSTEYQPMASIPSATPASNSEDLLQAWNPRKYRKKEPAGDGTFVKPETLLPESGREPSSITGNTRNTEPASARSGSTRNEPNTAPSTSGSSSTRTGPSSKIRQSSNASETLPDRRKRSSDAALHDDRRPSAAKQPKRSSNATSSQLPTVLAAGRSGADRQPPQWYKDLPKPKGTRGPDDAGVEIVLTRIKGAIKPVKDSNAQTRAATLAEKSAIILKGLHQLAFLPVTDKLLRKVRMLDNANGLPQLFDDHFCGGIDWPWYLRADAEELYNKWCMKIFETDPYRGLIRAMKSKGKSSSGNYDKLEQGSEQYRLVSPKQHGNGLLINGTWWPTQLAVLRDGGHGSSQAGITSQPDKGAFSVIMAGGLDSKSNPYPNIDEGDKVWYCGTDNLKTEINEPSPETNAMILNFENKRPVRLFRSSNLGTQFAPEKGFRYDGLYQVDDFELMDPPEQTRKRHRFKLVRCLGQDPIRHEGLAKRPTKEELEEYEKDKKNRGR